MFWKEGQSPRSEFISMHLGREIKLLLLVVFFPYFFKIFYFRILHISVFLLCFFYSFSSAFIIYDFLIYISYKSIEQNLNHDSSLWRGMNTPFMLPSFCVETKGEKNVHSSRACHRLYTGCLKVVTNYPIHSAAKRSKRETKVPLMLRLP